MSITALLNENSAAIVDRWQQDTFALYAESASKFFAREKNQFANPVGSAIRTGTRSIVENLLGEFDAERACRDLHEIIKIRAIQDFSPSRAVSFVFLLKDAVRAGLAGTDLDARHTRELAGIDANIDQIALFAFDIYVKCREQMYELRVNEVKRSVAVLMKRFDSDDSRSGSVISLSDEGSKSQGGDR